MVYRIQDSETTSGDKPAGMQCEYPIHLIQEQLRAIEGRLRSARDLSPEIRSDFTDLLAELRWQVNHPVPPVQDAARVEWEPDAPAEDEAPAAVEAEAPMEIEIVEPVSAETSLAKANEELSRFFAKKKLVPEETLKAALARAGKKPAGSSIPTSLLEEISGRDSAMLDSLMSGILDHCRIAYAFLDYYHCERAVVKMLPEELTLGRMIVPFDVMSRTVLVATANPFDEEAKQEVEQRLDYHVQWHLASPAAIRTVLADVYRQETCATPAAFRLAEV